VVGKDELGRQIRASKATRGSLPKRRPNISMSHASGYLHEAISSHHALFWADIPSPVSHFEGDREFADSPLEESGFEPSVPPAKKESFPLQIQFGAGPVPEQREAKGHQQVLCSKLAPAGRRRGGAPRFSSSCSGRQATPCIRRPIRVERVAKIGSQIPFLSPAVPATRLFPPGLQCRVWTSPLQKIP
jgi:hypothetical protein